MRAALLVPAAWLIVLSGCSSVQQVAGSAPIRSGEVTGDYRSVAACLARNGLPSNTSLVADEPRRVATIVQMLPGVGITETTLRPAGSARTAIEVRADDTTLVSARSRANDIMALAERCAATAHAAPAQR